WPASLETLAFGECFNQPLVGVTWPASLRTLNFGICPFGLTNSYPFAGDTWPPHVHETTEIFHEPDGVVGWPAQPIAEVVWPAFLEQLSFGSTCDQPIDGTAWPASLRKLSLGAYF
ncbi:unnamed protein product, partial [Laminaria digitata]